MSSERIAYIECYEGRRSGSFTGQGTRAVFKVSSSMSQAPNTMLLDMYGVGEADAMRAIAKAHTVWLYAGTEDYNGLIGGGQVVSAKKSRKEHGDALEIITVDGDDFYTTPINRTFAGNITLQTLVEGLVNASGAAAGIGFISPKARDISLPRGMSVLGLPSQAIRNVAKQINAAFYVNQGLVYLVCPDELTNNPITIYSTNLFQEPEHEGFYVSIESMLDHRVLAGRTLILSDEGRGEMYRVLSVVTEGDTKGPAWKTRIEGAEQNKESFAQTAYTDSIWR